VCLIGVEELAAEPATLVQDAAGHLEPPASFIPSALTGSNPEMVMSRSIAAAARSSSLAQT